MPIFTKFHVANYVKGGGGGRWGRGGGGGGMGGSGEGVNIYINGQCLLIDNLIWPPCSYSVFFYLRVPLQRLIIFPWDS